MSSPFYHGGHDLAGLIRELYRLFLSLRETQDELARQIASREIVLSRELSQGWYLEWASALEQGAGWARVGGRRIIIVVSGERRDPAEFRYHEPPLPVRPELLVEEGLPQPDADLPSIATEDPPASDAASLPSGRWHVLTVVLEGWRQGGLSAPLMQEYFARLVENGAIKLSEALPEGWMLSLMKFGGRVTGKKHFLFIAPGGKDLWADEIGCQLSDLRILDPRQLSRFLAPVVVETLPKDDASPPSEERPEGQSEATLESAMIEPASSTDGRELVVWKETLIPLLNTLRDGHQLANKNAAYHAVVRCLTGNGLTMSKGAIYEGLNRHHAEWSPAKADKPAK